MSDNGRLDQLPATEDGYQTDVWSRMAQDLIQRRAPSTQPFFLWLTPHEPHAGGPPDADDPQRVWAGRRGGNSGTTRPPARYRDHFANLPLPMPPSFNEADVSDKPSGIRNLPALTAGQIAAIREAYQQALEADLGVDDMVAAVVDRLKASGELENTLIIFTSDNGFFYGEHHVARARFCCTSRRSAFRSSFAGPASPRAFTSSSWRRTSTSLRRSSRRPVPEPG
jgi:N-acetylglucosamine-6-sulfatase